MKVLLVPILICIKKNAACQNEPTVYGSYKACITADKRDITEGTSNTVPCTYVPIQIGDIIWAQQLYNGNTSWAEARVTTVFQPNELPFVGYIYSVSHLLAE